MNKRLSGRSGLFLLELIISILFFSLSSAVCIRLFVTAHTTDRENYALSESVKLCTNYAEIYTAGNRDRVRKFYDLRFEECSETEALYQLSLTDAVSDVEGGGSLRYATVSVRDLEKNEIIYAFPITVYDSEKGDA